MSSYDFLLVFDDFLYIFYDFLYILCGLLYVCLIHFLCFHRNFCPGLLESACPEMCLCWGVASQYAMTRSMGIKLTDGGPYGLGLLITLGLFGLRNPTRCGGTGVVMSRSARLAVALFSCRISCNGFI